MSHIFFGRVRKKVLKTHSVIFSKEFAGLSVPALLADTSGECIFWIVRWRNRQLSCYENWCEHPSISYSHLLFPLYIIIFCETRHWIYIFFVSTTPTSTSFISESIHFYQKKKNSNFLLYSSNVILWSVPLKSQCFVAIILYFHFHLATSI